MKNVADYQLVEQLQPGNHGTFYLAKPPGRLGLDDDLVALKVLDRYATDNEFKRMAAELNVLLEVDHPYLVDVIDAGHDQGRLYYATRYYRDGSLGPGPSTEVKVLATQVADAAEAAHALHQIGVAHRDIKPTNILLNNGRGHLSDLGVANYVNANFTATGSSPVGTLAYADPELIHGRAPGRASDIWSLGATLHMVVTGRSIIGDIPNTQLAAAIEYVIQAEALLAPNCPGSIAAIVARATQPHPVDRYQTAQELANALRAVADQPQTPLPASESEENKQAGPGNVFPVAGTREANAAVPPYEHPVYVIGLRSTPGYFNHPDAEICRLSGQERASSGSWISERGPRPPLGILLDDDGRGHLVQWNMVVGRQPETDEQVAEGLAAPLTYPSDLTMSRVHLRIELRDWNVYVTDLSSNGSRIRSQSESEPRRLPPGEATLLADGDILLIEARTLTYHGYY